MGLWAAHRLGPPQWHPHCLPKHSNLSGEKVTLSSPGSEARSGGLVSWKQWPLHRVGGRVWINTLGSLGLMCWGAWFILQPSCQVPGSPRSSREIPILLRGPELISLAFNQRSCVLCGAVLVPLSQHKLPGTVAAWHSLHVNFAQGIERCPVSSGLCCLESTSVPCRACVSRRPLVKEHNHSQPL